jgi:hypothetical protein
MRPSGLERNPAGFRGYRLHVDLKAESWSPDKQAFARLMPNKGLNSASVRLLTKDATMVEEVAVHDAIVVVEYLAHKNGIRDDVDFYRPGSPTRGFG